MTSSNPSRNSFAVRSALSVFLAATVCGCTEHTITTPPPLVPAAIEPVTASPTTGVAGAVLPDVVVRVIDKTGQRIEGVPVTFAVTAGGGSVSQAFTVSGAQGVAQTSWTLGTQAGVNRLEVRAEGLDTPLILEVNGTAGAAKKFVIVSGADQTDTVGRTLAPIVLRLTDANGNPVVGEAVNWYFGWTFAGQPVSSGTVVPTSGVTNANGEWSGTWTLGPNAGQFQITAVAATSGMALGIIATARPEKPDRMTLSEPGSVFEFDSFTVQVRSFDQFGNLSGGLPVNLEPTNGSSVSPTTLTTDAAGNGFASWTMPTAPAAVALIATTPSSANADTSNAAVIHTAPVRMVVFPDTAFSVPMSFDSTGAPTYHATMEDQYGHGIPIRFNCGDFVWSATPPAQVHAQVGMLIGNGIAWSPERGTFNITGSCPSRGLSSSAILIVR